RVRLVDDRKPHAGARRLRHLAPRLAVLQRDHAAPPPRRRRVHGLVPPPPPGGAGADEPPARARVGGAQPLPDVAAPARQPPSPREPLPGMGISSTTSIQPSGIMKCGCSFDASAT